MTDNPQPLLDAVLPTVMKDEGFRRKPYRCTNGFLSIGYGTNLDAGLDDEEAMFLLEHRLNKSIAGCVAGFAWFKGLDAVRQAVIVMMAYQLGVDGVREFRDLCAALERGDYLAAAAAMRDSKWAKADSPARAYRLARAMELGRFL